MRILIIGGTAFMGPHVVRRLCDEGHHVTVMHRGITECEMPAKVDHVHRSALGIGERCLVEVKAEIDRVSPDVVLDMIPLTENDARLAMDAFRGIAQRMVAISSQDVYRAYDRMRGRDPGPPDPTPLTEDSPLRERLFPYREETSRPEDDRRKWLDDYDKILVEQVVMNDPDLPGTVLRLPAVYGPGDKQHRTFEFLKRMDDGRPAILISETMANWRWTRGYVENMSFAIAVAVTNEKAAGRIYNVGEGALSISEWATRIGKAANWNGKLVILPEEKMPPHLKSTMHTDQDFVVDSARIREELGYRELVSLDEGLRRTIEWERAHPPENVDASRFAYDAEDVVLGEG